MAKAGKERGRTNGDPPPPLPLHTLARIEFSVSLVVYIEVIEQ